LETEGATPDATLLTRAESLLQERLRTQPLDSELAHLGYELFGHLGKCAETRALLEPYRTQRLDTEPYEAAWAWWVIDDCLALERKASELVRQQAELLGWSLQRFPAEQCLFAISDSTQASCWWMLGQREGWFALFNDLMSRITPTEQNRDDRFETLRTATVLYVRSERKDQVEQAQPLFSSLYDLVEEDATWAQHDDRLIEIQSMHIKALHILGQTQSVRELGAQATHLLRSWMSRVAEPSVEERRQFRRLCHNIAAALYYARQYDLAIPLFEQAIAYGVSTPHPFLWLAASLWVTTQDRPRVFALLEQARAHDASGRIAKHMSEAPEFANLQSDPQFAFLACNAS
jgi:hypothetical protein